MSQRGIIVKIPSACLRPYSPGLYGYQLMKLIKRGLPWLVFKASSCWYDLPVCRERLVRAPGPILFACACAVDVGIFVCTRVIVFVFNLRFLGFCHSFLLLHPPSLLLQSPPSPSMVETFPDHVSLPMSVTKAQGKELASK